MTTKATTFRVLDNGESKESSTAAGTADTSFMHSTNSGGTDVYGLSISYNADGAVLTWTQNSGDSYEIWTRKPGGAPGEGGVWTTQGSEGLITTPGVQTADLTWAQLAVTGGLDIAVSNGAGGTAPSYVTNMVTGSLPQSLTAPTLSMTVDNINSEDDFSWTSAGGGVHYVLIDEEGKYGPQALASPTTGTSINLPFDEAGTGKFAVVAYDTGGNGTLSNILDYALPATPTGIAASPMGRSAMGVTWTDIPYDETGYTLERSGDGGSTWTTLSSTIGPDLAAFEDTSVLNGINYIYRVKTNGSNDTGDVGSDWDTTGTVTTSYMASKTVTGKRYRIDVVGGIPAVENIAASGTVTFDVKVWDTTTSSYATTIDVGQTNSGILTSSTLRDATDLTILHVTVTGGGTITASSLMTLVMTASTDNTATLILDFNGK